MREERGERNQIMAKCALCGEVVPADELQAHLKEDSDEIRDYVISVIRKNNPEWVAEDGSCPKCWEHFRNL